MTEIKDITPEKLRSKNVEQINEIAHQIISNNCSHTWFDISDEYYDKKCACGAKLRIGYGSHELITVPDYGLNMNNAMDLLDFAYRHFWDYTLKRLRNSDKTIAILENLKTKEKFQYSSHSMPNSITKCFILAMLSEKFQKNIRKDENKK